MKLSILNIHSYFRRAKVSLMDFQKEICYIKWPFAKKENALCVQFIKILDYPPSCAICSIKMKYPVLSDKDLR